MEESHIGRKKARGGENGDVCELRTKTGRQKQWQTEGWGC